MASWVVLVLLVGGVGKGGGVGPVLHLCQVRRQVECEPPVPGPEGLGLRGLGLPHQSEPVVERLEVYDPVVPDPELPLAA